MRLRTILLVGLLRGVALADAPPPADAASSTAAPVPSREPAPAPGRSKGVALQAAGLVLVAVGIAGIGAGIGAGLRAANTSQDLTLAAQAHMPYDAAAYANGKTLELVAIVGDLVGGVALLAGAVVFAMGYSASLTVAPEVGPGRAGASLRWKF